MSGRKPQVMKSTVKAASGGVVVVAALIALMFLRGVGTGSGETEGEGLSPVPPTMTTTEPPENDNPGAVEESTSEGGLTPDEKSALSDNVLGILIDDWEYLLEVPGESESVYRPATLDRLVVLANQANGDSNGIRVRILQRESARPKAEQQLRQKLAEVGIDTSAIYMPEEFIP